MPIEAMVIIILVGFVSIYMFYLVSIYIKLENRRSLILSKFTEIDYQISNKLDLIKELVNILEDNNFEQTRNELVKSISVNDKINYNKKIDNLIKNIDTSSRKAKKVINSISEINDRIDYAKEFYNGSLYEYNIILNSFSGKIIKKLFNYTEYIKF